MYNNIPDGKLNIAKQLYNSVWTPDFVHRKTAIVMIRNNWISNRHNGMLEMMVRYVSPNIHCVTLLTFCFMG